MKKRINQNKYDTLDKKIQFLKKKGNIITFKEPFYPNGTANDSRKQIIVGKLKQHRTDEVKIIGEFYDSNWYKNINELLDAIDWNLMEKMHFLNY